MELMLLRQFQRQVAHQCHAAIINAHLLDEAVNDPSRDVSDVGRIQEHTWAGMQGLLTAVANISKALWGQGGALAKQREPLRSSLAVEESSPLKPTSMRNNFDHFDDRLDTWWKESKQHNHIDYVIAGDNFSRGVAPTDIFRHFNPTTGEVIFWGDRYSVRAIVAEIERILPIAEAEAAKPHWQRPSDSGSGQ